ncbi:MAG: ribokinase [Cyclobacteriaceae bacterium]|nr:ribokinase [Cyclobacteriaceae bacterium SS2]
MNPNILVIGSSNTDMVTLSDRLPKPGETVIAKEFYIAQGGKGANQAVAAARLGGEVTFVAKVGNDDFGRQAIAGYQKDGINTDLMTQDSDAPTGTALINIDATGENMIVATMGANARLSIKDVEKSLDQMKSAKVVLSQLEIPLETTLYAAKQATELGIPFILNPAPPNTLSDELIALCTYIIPNETEASYFSGVTLKSDLDIQHAGQYFIQKGAENVIITLGARGAFLHNDRTSQFITAPTVKAVDTVGAGDVFCGAFTLAIAEGKPASEAVRFANRSASLAVTRKGVQGGIPYRKEIG